MNYVTVDAGFAGDVKVTATASGRVKLTVGDGYLATYFDRQQAVSLLQQLRNALEPKADVRRADSSVREIRRDVEAAQTAADTRESLY